MTNRELEINPLKAQGPWHGFPTMLLFHQLYDPEAYISGLALTSFNTLRRLQISIEAINLY